MKDSFIFYKSFYDAIKKLDAETKANIYDAICEKALYDEDIELTGLAEIVYTLIKPQLEANNKRYADGCKGGRPKKETSGFENEKPVVLKNARK